jgi:hypothetical protein
VIPLCTPPYFGRKVINHPIQHGYETIDKLLEKINLIYTDAREEKVIKSLPKKFSNRETE